MVTADGKDIGQFLLLILFIEEENFKSFVVTTGRGSLIPDGVIS